VPITDFCDKNQPTPESFLILFLDVYRSFLLLGILPFAKPATIGAASGKPTRRMASRRVSRWQGCPTKLSWCGVV
jgi:hypothetical protein